MTKGVCRCHEINCEMSAQCWRHLVGDNLDMLRQVLYLPPDADVETVCGSALAEIERSRQFSSIGGGK